VQQQRGTIDRLIPLQPGLRGDHAYQFLRQEIRRSLRRHRAPQTEMDDLEKDVLLALMQLAGAPRRAQLSTWIWSVCRNVVMDYRKRDTTRRHAESEVATSILASVASPEEAQDGADAWSWLCRALWHLPPRSRHVVFLRELDDASYATIADALRISETLARVAHHRGMKRLSQYAIETRSPR
jgi:RNA polymerase sigma factor (sigma-70 family)